LKVTVARNRNVPHPFMLRAKPSSRPWGTVRTGVAKVRGGR
jgi:hypothetical protein